jgi:hypothetical protein
MQQVARETWVAFERRLERARVPAPQRPNYHKWTRFYTELAVRQGVAASTQNQAFGMVEG